MTKRLLLLAIMALAVSFVACGGGDDDSPTVTPTPTPPTRADITFRLDPPAVTAVYEGNGRYAYNVNLEFYDNAGIGFRVDTLQLVISSPAGQVYLNEVDTINHYVGPLGRWVTQYTVRYTVGGTRLALVTRFTANFTDDRGNALTATAQVNVLHNGQPKRLP